MVVGGVVWCGVVWCGVVWCGVVVCVVCEMWDVRCVLGHAETSPCVDSSRLPVYECTHGGVRSRGRGREMGGRGRERKRKQQGSRVHQRSTESFHLILLI